MFGIQLRVARRIKQGCLLQDIHSDKMLLLRVRCDKIADYMLGTHVQQMSSRANMSKMCKG